jgi:hypothetical protein
VHDDLLEPADLGVDVEAIATSFPVGLRWWPVGAKAPDRKLSTISVGAGPGGGELLVSLGDERDRVDPGAGQLLEAADAPAPDDLGVASGWNCSPSADPRA